MTRMTRTGFSRCSCAATSSGTVKVLSEFKCPRNSMAFIVRGAPLDLSWISRILQVLVQVIIGHHVGRFDRPLALTACRCDRGESELDLCGDVSGFSRDGFPRRA